MIRPALVAALLLAQTAPAAAASEATTGLQICGTLREHRPATPSASGLLGIGSASYPIAPGTVAGNGGVEVVPGRDLCVQATQGRTSAQLVYYLFFPLPADRVCGNNIGSTQTTTAIAADFGAMTLRRGSGLVPAQGSERVCYAFQVDRPSGELVATVVLPVRDIDRERNSACGTVKVYTRATAASSGSIAIGSRSYRIAAGVAYTGDPAGDRTDRTTVGSNMCLYATLGTTGEIVEYLTNALFPASVTGTVHAYTSPAGGQSGIATLTYASRFTIRIPAAVDAAVDLSRGGARCFSTTVDAAGDLTASAIITCQPGVATGPGPTTTSVPAASAAPTSAAPGPTAIATPTATPTPLAVASPPPDATTTTTVRVGPDPLLVAGVMGIAALGLLAVYLSRRRAR